MLVHTDTIGSTARGKYTFVVSPAPPTMAVAPLSNDPCTQNSGNSAFFLIDALDGHASDDPVWDINGDGKIDEKDSNAAGYTADGAGQNTVVTKDEDCVNVTAGGNKLCSPPKAPPTTAKKRVWQQIMTPPF